MFGTGLQPDEFTVAQHADREQIGEEQNNLHDDTKRAIHGKHDHR